MNPFEEEDTTLFEDNQPSNTIENINIEIWRENMGRKKNTYIKGFIFSSEQIKYIKKKYGCNGTFKNDTTGKIVTHFQGDIVNNIYEYIISLNVLPENIRIKG
jgi:translation initiation factor 1 (eIF-1/SUI1)